MYDRVQNLAFLSCLYGSEQSTPSSKLPAIFLSCLYGSELNIKYVVTTIEFLSCLYGSELPHDADSKADSLSKLPVWQ